MDRSLITIALVVFIVAISSLVYVWLLERASVRKWSWSPTIKWITIGYSLILALGVATVLSIWLAVPVWFLLLFMIFQPLVILVGFDLFSKRTGQSKEDTSQKLQS